MAIVTKFPDEHFFSYDRFHYQDNGRTLVHHTQSFQMSMTTTSSQSLVEFS